MYILYDIFSIVCVCRYIKHVKMNFTYRIARNIGKVLGDTILGFVMHAAKFKTCQFVLGTDLPNLTLTKVSHYTVYYKYMQRFFILYVYINVMNLINKYTVTILQYIPLEAAG